MTAEELTALLLALPEEQRKLPVAIEVERHGAMYAAEEASAPQVAQTQEGAALLILQWGSGRMWLLGRRS